MLCEELRNFTHLDTGDLFRNHVAAKTPLGQQAYAFMQRGELVPDDITNAMVAERLSAADTLRQATCWTAFRGPSSRRVG